MPLNLTPRRKAFKAPTPARLAEVGKRHGTNDNGSVLDRVRQWQEKGGGVVTAPDVYFEESEASAGCEEGEDHHEFVQQRHRANHQPPTPNRRSELREPQTSDTHKRRTRREYSEEPTTQQRPHSASAPKRRIVSDSHWRTDHKPFETHQTRPVKDPPPSWAMPDDGIRVRPMPDPEPSNNPRRDRAAPRDSRHYSVNDGIRVYSTQPDPPTESPSHRYADEDSRYVGDDCTQEGLSFHSPTPSERDTRRRTSCDATMDEGVPSLYGNPRGERTRGKSRDGRTPRSRPGVRFAEPAKEEKKGTKRLSKSGILSNVLEESKKIFGRTETPAVQDHKLPTIESWLNNTPDPFIDQYTFGNGDQHSEPMEQISDIHRAEASPAERTSERRKRHSGARKSSGDPNGIWDTVGTPEKRSSDRRNRRHAERRIPSAAAPGTAEDGHVDSRPSREAETPTRSSRKKGDADESSSPSSLRRRGAHKKSHSPSKGGRSSVSGLKSAFSGPTRHNPSALSSADSGYTTEGAEYVAPLKPRKHFASNDMPVLGRKLSTIASVDTHQSSLDENVRGGKISDGIGQTERELPAENVAAPDTTGLDRRSSKTKITKHSDLMSILSQPNLAKGKSLRSARSIRTNRTKPETTTILDIMSELAKDEVVYMRELRTLVDGVIPVLLTSILSKSDSAATVGMFSSKRAKDDPNATKPIYDMGIALERLKRAHKRLSLDRADSFLSWARSTQYIYWDYLQAWRLGFQDIVVNLAAADAAADKAREDSAVDDGLARNESGDVVDSTGERVDVAFLLKRPLVRLKTLSRTIRNINVVDPSSSAADMEKKYQALLDEARSRVNEERARLEDEAAAAIDSTRARELQSLATHDDVIIDENLRVRARDCFNLTLNHTSCQVLDCRVELFLREDPKSKDKSGDVLICEIDGTGRWLLFPPVSTKDVSARNGDQKGEIVVMVRGTKDTKEWHELLCLRSDEEETGFEWVQMLGLVPIPPGIQRSRSFLERQDKVQLFALEAPDSHPKISQENSVDVPLGEHARRRKRATSNASGAATQQPERARLQKTQHTADVSSGGALQLPIRGSGQLQTVENTSKKLRKSMPTGVAVENGPLVDMHVPTQEPKSARKTAHSNKQPLEQGAETTHRNNRSNSPLKKEYEPSTASDSSSDSDGSSDRQDLSSTSDSDADLEDGDVAMPLLPPGALNRLKSGPGARNVASGQQGSLAPSDSASQAPYKHVPQQPQQANKTIASIFYWSNKGAWESMHPDECSIVVTPGLIEAFEMSALHSKLPRNAIIEGGSNPSSRASSADPQPLIGLELTPLVPIRRGTALDISVRSPPTAESKIKQIQNANVMFRSRNPEECEALYALINHARINNPTYIALQNARATSFTKPFGGASFDASKDGSRSSWFGFGAGNRSSYRASSAPTPSAARQSESSTGSATSAFNALRKIGMRSSRFSIARSTIISRAFDGSRHSGSVFSSSEQSSTSGTSTPLPAGIAAAMGAVDAQNTAGAAPIGLSNAKIRLYIRETTSKWRDLGAAQLTIMRPAGEHVDGTSSGEPAALSIAAPSQAAAGATGEPALRAPGSGQPSNSDKRVLVTSKKTGEMLLDVTLGESCFERVARTGIAVSVWETLHDGQVGDKGGVVGGRFRVYMVQMQSEAETAYTFGIVGRFRY